MSFIQNPLIRESLPHNITSNDDSSVVYTKHIIISYILNNDHNVINEYIISRLFQFYHQLDRQTSIVIWEKVTRVWLQKNAHLYVKETDEDDEYKKQKLSSKCYYLTELQGMSSEMIWCCTHESYFIMSCLLFHRCFPCISTLSHYYLKRENVKEISIMIDIIENIWVSCRYDKLDNCFFDDYTIPFIHIIVREFLQSENLELQKNYDFARVQCLCWTLFSLFFFKKTIDENTLPMYSRFSKRVRIQKKIPNTRLPIDKKGKFSLCKNWTDYKKLEPNGYYLYEDKSKLGLSNEDKILHIIRTTFDTYARESYIDIYRAKCYRSRLRITDSLRYSLSHFPEYDGKSCIALFLQTEKIKLHGVREERKSYIKKKEQEQLDQTNTDDESLGKKKKKIEIEYDDIEDAEVADYGNNNPIFLEMKRYRHIRFHTDYSYIADNLREHPSVLIEMDEHKEKAKGDNRKHIRVFDKKEYNLLSIFYEVFTEQLFRNKYAFEINDILLEDDDLFRYSFALTNIDKTKNVLSSTKKGECDYIIAKIGGLYYLFSNILSQRIHTKTTKISLVMINCNYIKILCHVLALINEGSNKNNKLNLSL